MTQSHSNALWWIKREMPKWRWIEVSDRQIKIILEIKDKIPEITIDGNKIWKDEKQDLHRKVF